MRPTTAAKGKKPPMSTTLVRRPRTGKAEKEFVDSLDKILTPALAKLSPEERQSRVKSLKDYLDSLESDAKRA
jgi:hypothetical protein